MPSVPASARNNEANTIKILVATDNHVGYEERDPVRKDDSWKTFDEILQIAVKHEVDLVLLGGDLFHENRPSRKSMFQVMRSLRKYCLGNRPCQVEFLSDANDVFEGAFPHVNYEDPDINISLPVFSIHGNHDDPGGDGHYCSLDLLQVAGLVNYFGRVPEADNIHVKPVLLQKGDTQLALYGISNVRDERIWRTFRDKKVTFYKPPEDAGKFFNLLTVHQNHTAHTMTSYLPESVLPNWMNLVVWGHEHDSKIEPVQNPETGFFVMQPGSSIATSLTPGEAEPKKVAIVKVTGEEFTTEAVPLKTVRPFAHREIVLRKEAAFKELQFTTNEKKHREVLTERLYEVVQDLIAEANQTWLSLQDDPDNIKEEDQPLPLIRLKVEYSAEEGGSFDVGNPQRFSNLFVGEVANTRDVVSFYRKKSTTKLEKGESKLPKAIKEAIENEDIIRIDVLVREFLQQSSLKVLPQNHFEDALLEYIDKGSKDAVDDFVNETLSKSLKYLVKLDDNQLSKNLEATIEQCKEALQKRWAEAEGGKWTQKRRLKPRPDDYDSDLEGPWEDPDNPDRWENIKPSSGAKAKGQARRSTGNEDVDMDDDDDSLFVRDASIEDQFDKPPAMPAGKKGAAAKGGRGAAAKKAPAAKKTPARGRPKKKGFVLESDGDEEEEAHGDSMSLDEFNEDEEEDDPPAPAPKRGSRATKTTTTRATASRASKPPAANKTRQSTLNFSQSQRPTSRVNPSQQKTLTISDDEIDDDDDEAFEPVRATRSRRR